MKKHGWSNDDTGVCVVTFEELATAKERTDGAINAFTAASFPQNHIHKAPQRTSDIPGAFDAVTILLTQHPAIKHWLICGMNDSAVLGAVRALEQRGFEPDSCAGVGINGTDCISELERAKPTSFYGSMLNSAKAHGYKTSEMMFHWIKDGTEPALDTRTIGVLITRDNFRQILKEQGIRD
jgi:L-arabinose transport system substrate-binding protein